MKKLKLLNFIKKPNKVLVFIRQKSILIERRTVWLKDGIFLTKTYIFAKTSSELDRVVDFVIYV